MDQNKNHPEEFVDLMSGGKPGKPKKKMSTAKKVILIVVIILVLLIGGLVWYVYSFLNLIDVQPPYSSIPGTSSTSSQQQVEQKTGVTNILLIGSDSRTSEVKGHSDSMILLSIDRDHQKIKMTSIMRDIYVPNITETYSDRINTAYLVGGADLMLATINKNFDMQIDQYAIVNFQMFEEVVDKLGGVTLSVTQQEAKEMNNHIEGSENFVSAGEDQLLNGVQALAYARIRKGVGDDYARTDRQREVLGQIINECKDLNVFQITEIMQTVLPYVTTNISKTEILGYAVEAGTLMNYEQEDLRLPVDGAFEETYINGMSVLKVDFEKNTEALHDFIYEDQEEESSSEDASSTRSAE